MVSLTVVGGAGAGCGGAPPDDDDLDGDADCQRSWGLRDGTTGLCWQDPPEASYMDWEQAIAWCDELTVGGASDWRLPNIEELASLLRGCDDGTIGSASTESSCTLLPEGCAAEDACVDQAACGECSYYEGPAADGCYWEGALTGACTNAYWSASTDGGNGINPWFVTFGNGSVGGPGTATSVFHVRCMRGGG